MWSLWLEQPPSSLYLWHPLTLPHPFLLSLLLREEEGFFPPADVGCCFLVDHLYLSKPHWSTARSSVPDLKLDWVPLVHALRIYSAFSQKHLSGFIISKILSV